MGSQERWWCGRRAAVWAAAGLAGLVHGAAALSQDAASAPASVPAQGAASTSGRAAIDAEYVRKANEIYKRRDQAVADESRTDLILLPKIAAMQPPPADSGLASLLHAALLSPKLSPAQWPAAEKWAAAPAQQEAIEAMRKATAPGERFAFQQGYGRDAADPAVRSAGLYTDLGDPPLLAAARFNALAGLDRLGMAVQVEATRLGEAGKARDAASLLVRWVMLGRQMADREFFREKRWGYIAMQSGIERILDVIRTYPSSLKDQDLADLNADLDRKSLLVERIQMPQGDRLAAEQVVARSFVERGGVDAGAFGPTMARVTSAGRPLTQYGESARWGESGAKHASTYDTGDQVRFVFDDWAKRWALPPFDRALDRPSDFEKMDKARFAAVDAIAAPVEEMFRLRLRLNTLLGGARQALAVQAYALRYQKFPPNQQATRPAYIKDLDPDPYTPDRRDFHLFVPIRDTPQKERELPKPHFMGVAAPGMTEDGPTADVAREVEKIGTALVDLGKAKLEALAKTVDEAQKASYGQPSPAAQEALKGLAGVAKEWDAKRAELLAAVDPAIRDRVTADAERGAGFDPSAIDRELRRSLPDPSDANAKRPSAAEQVAKIVDAWRAGIKAAPRSSFVVTLDDKQFVLYSVGPDQQRNWAKSVGAGGSDVLIWPPLISLVRDELVRRNVGVAGVSGPWLEYEPGGQPPSAEEVRRREGTRQQQGSSPAPSSPGPSRPGPGRLPG